LFCKPCKVEPAAVENGVEPAAIENGVEDMDTLDDDVIMKTCFDLLDTLSEDQAAAFVAIMDDLETPDDIADVLLSFADSTTVSTPRSDTLYASTVSRALSFSSLTPRSDTESNLCTPQCKPPRDLSMTPSDAGNNGTIADDIMAYGAHISDDKPVHAKTEPIHDLLTAYAYPDAPMNGSYMGFEMTMTDTTSDPLLEILTSDGRDDHDGHDSSVPLLYHLTNNYTTGDISDVDTLPGDISDAVALSAPADETELNDLLGMLEDSAASCEAPLFQSLF
jgi:hypothetical protein